MEKKKFQSSFSDHIDTSNCGLERSTEKDFEAYVYDESMRIINRNAHSATVTDIVGVCAAGSEISDKILGDLRGIVRGYLSFFFNKCNLYGYTYSKDHKLILVSKESESWIVNCDDLSNVCEYVTTGNITPAIMRSIISLMDRDDVSASMFNLRNEVSVNMFNLMVEYAMG